MRITRRYFQEATYSYNKEFSSLEEFDQFFMRQTALMELSFNGVQFIERGNVIIENWNNRKELLGL